MSLPSDRDHNFKNSAELHSYFTSGEYSREVEAAAENLLSSFDPETDAKLPSDIVRLCGFKNRRSVTTESTKLIKRPISEVPQMRHLNNIQSVFVLERAGNIYIYNSFGEPMPAYNKNALPSEDDPEIERKLRRIFEE